MGVQNLSFSLIMSRLDIFPKKQMVGITQEFMKNVGFLFKHFVYLFLGFLFSFSAFAGPVTISLQMDTWTEPRKAQCVLTIAIPENVKMMGPSQKGDTLERPPTVSWEGSTNAETVEVSWPEGTLWREDGQQSHVYTGTISVPVNVTLVTPGKARLVFVLKGIACSNVCRPVYEKISFDLKTPDNMTTDKPSCCGGSSHEKVWEKFKKWAETSFWGLIVCAFLGGALMNIMPCVLPVIGIKFRSFAHAGQGELRRLCLWSLAGVLTIFWIFAGIAIFLKVFFQETMGWGLQFQNPFFAAGMAIIMGLFSLSLLGLFHVHPPKWIQRLVPQSQHSSIGAFLSGILSVLLGSPCCAPLMGFSVGFALTRGVPEIFATFTSVALGFSLPYLLGILLPINRFLPKPGGWMTWAERIVGLLLVVTTVWLLWIWGGLQGPTLRYVGFALFGLAIFSLVFIKVRYGTKASYGALTIPVLSFFAFFALSILPDTGKQPLPTAVRSPSGRVLWMPWTQKAQDEAVAQGKIVFVDITARWCATCVRNKISVLERENVENALISRDVVAMRADITREVPEEVEAVNKIKAHYKRAGIPINIVISRRVPKGILLSEFLTEDDVMSALKRAGVRDLTK